MLERKLICIGNAWLGWVAILANWNQIDLRWWWVGEGRRGDETAPPPPPPGPPPRQIFPEILDPSVILAKTSATPTPLDFQPVCIYASIEQNKLYKPGVPNLLVIAYHYRSIKNFTYHLMVFLSNCVLPKHTSCLKSTKQMLNIRFLRTTYRLFAYH